MIAARFDVPGRFPSYNSLLRSARHDEGYEARRKRELTRRVQACCSGIAVKGRPPYTVRLTWFEHSPSRDVDNVQGGAKFILDGMKWAGLIPDDSRAYVANIEHRFRRAERDHVLVELLTERGT